MNINSKLTFGKYKGLTIKEIFQGSNKIDKYLIEKYLQEISNNWDSTKNQKGLISEILTFEISDTLIRATPHVPEFAGNFSQQIAALFRKETSYINRLLGTSFEEFITVKKTEENADLTLTCGGNPEYITWCINKIDSFYIAPEELKKLQELPIFRFEKMVVVFKIEDIYTYEALFYNEKYVFAHSTVQKNQEKYEADSLKYFSRTRRTRGQ